MRIKTTIALGLVLALCPALCPIVLAQEPAPGRATFQDAAADAKQRLEASIVELNELRAEIAEQKIPLSRQLGDLEAELGDVRREYAETSRQLDSRTLDLNNLRTEIKQRKEETGYLSNLLGEYIRKFEAGLHIAELQRYAPQLERARLAPENSNLSEQEVFEAQAALLDVSLERLNDALGGTRFEGTAVDSGGLVKQGSFVMVGPAVIFLPADGQPAGTAEQRLGSLEPASVAFGSPKDAVAAARVASGEAGFFPLDPTLGDAHKIEATEEPLWEHIQKGGPVMIPIFALAAAALLVALYKWLALTLVRKPSRRSVEGLLEAVARGDEAKARERAAELGGPIGRMLAAGVEHLREPRELIEEVLYEAVLKTRLKLQSLLPFIAISAACAPLLGLLGTVTGIISTFKLITVFGSGDVKSLSGGISEALITTKFGLIVAIPSLLIHAFLSRKARSVVNEMETRAVAFLNEVSKSQFRAASASGEGAQLPEAMRDEVREALQDLIVPMMRRSLDAELGRRAAAGEEGGVRPEARRGIVAGTPDAQGGL